MLQTKNADSIQHSSEKEFIYFKVHLSIRLQCPQFQGLIWLLLISYLNQQTVVYSFIGAKLNRQLQGGYSCKNLQHKFKFCLYLQNGLIKYPLILTGLFHNTLHTLILAMLIAPFMYYVESRRFHFCHDVDSQSFTSVDEMCEHPGLSAAPGDDSWVQHKRLCLQLSIRQVSKVSRHYENFRATKFNNPPCLNNVTSTSFSNEAITLNTFPVLVFKQTKTSPVSGNIFKVVKTMTRNQPK